VIPIAAHHLLDILQGELLPIVVADVLPAGNLFEHQQPICIAGVEKVRRLRIMRGPHDVTVQFLSQNPGVAFLNSGGHRLTGVRKSLMAIKAAQLQMLAVKVEAIGCELSFAKSDTRFVLIDQTAAGC